MQFKDRVHRHHLRLVILYASAVGFRTEQQVGFQIREASGHKSAVAEVDVASRNRKRPRSEKHSGSMTISFDGESGRESDAEVKEMIYRAAALRPVSLGAEEAVDKPKRRNVKVSSDPQTVAARHQREKISERLRVLQRLVPGGNKLDTATMLDEAANYLKFLKSQTEYLGSNAAPEMCMNKEPRKLLFRLSLELMQLFSPMDKLAVERHTP